MTLHRRTLLLATTALTLAACATRPSMKEYPPIVFVPGNGDSAALWITTLWRFESNGWPRDRLHAMEMPYPLARDDDGKAQAGRSSTAEHMAFLKREVDQVLKETGASKVVLIGNSRGGNAIRNYIQNGGGDQTVSHAILGGTPNHGIWAFKGFLDNSEFSAIGPFLTGLNAPKNAAGDEVTAAVKWMTIRSDNNDKYAQPDGVWIGQKGKPTNVTYEGPALKGAVNVVVANADHRETSFSAAAFAAAFEFITDRKPATLDVPAQDQVTLNGKISGMGVDSLAPATGKFSNNLPLPGARLTVYAVDRFTGARLGGPVHSRTAGSEGIWGPFTTQSGVALEFVISTPGYATTHIYRSPFPRSSDVVNLRPERLAAQDAQAKSVVIMTRPRGYFDAKRDMMSLDGQTALPGVPPTGAGVSSAKIQPEPQGRTVVARFNSETVIGVVAPQGEVAVLELTW